MTTAIIGVGNIGKSVARHLVEGGERVVLAARDETNATALANELGELASATSVEKAIVDADVVVFAMEARGDLPEELKLWIEKWLNKRGEREGAIAGTRGAYAPRNLPAADFRFFGNARLRQTD